VTRDELDRACRAPPGVTMEVLWGADEVYKVVGKMFVVASSTGGCSMKVSEIAFEALTANGQAKPAPYLARAGWVRFEDLGSLEAEEGGHLVASSHALVAAKLTRAQRRARGIV